MSQLANSLLILFEATCW